MNLRDAAAVSRVPGIALPRAAAALKALRERPGGDATTLEEVIAACGRDADVETLARASRAEAQALLAAATTSDIHAIPWDDERYPALLRAILDPPPILWVRGAVEVLACPAVAVVGSRAATSYALEVAFRLASELSHHGLAVVSGLARGVDGAAHRGCVTAGGRTVAVLGSGPDVVYPQEHRQLAADIGKTGALVSELGPGAPPLAQHFPMRNRLISGISLAVVVVEASERSGSLITARCALEQGRDVMAVPGSVLSGRNRGSHALLKDGAKVVESADDILEDLGWLSRSATASGRADAGESGDFQSAPTGGIEALTQGEAYDLDELILLTGLPGPQLLPRLTEWEMQGRVVRLAGGRYSLGTTYGKSTGGG